MWHYPYSINALFISLKVFFLLELNVWANSVYMYIMSKHGFVKISYSMSPWAWVLVVGSGHNGHIVKMSYFLKNLFVHAMIKNRILIVYMYLMMSTNTALLKS